MKLSKKQQDMILGASGLGSVVTTQKINKQVGDPLGVEQHKVDTSLGDSLMSQGYSSVQDAINDFKNMPPEKQQWLQDLIYSPQGQTELSKITTDPQFKQNQMQALSMLEEIAKSGLSERDKAELAKAEADINRQQSGRLGAIRQNMSARGVSGSGLDLVAQQQAAQDATQRQALLDMERQAMSQEGRRQATSQLGALSGQMQQQDWQQQAARAAAQDAINKFNTANTLGVDQFNIGGRQDVSNANTDIVNQNRRDVMGAGMQGGQIQYNYGADISNRALGQFAQKEQGRDKMRSSIIGGGAQIGAAFLSDKNCKEDIKSDNKEDIEEFLSQLQPKSYKYKGDEQQHHGIIAQDLQKSKIGKDMVGETEEGNLAVSIPDAVGALLQAVSLLNKKVKKG